MKKVAIRFFLDQNDEAKPIAQHLQRFIVEDDYKISTIIKKIKTSQRILLDVGMEENMPEFTEVVRIFDEDELQYELYKSIDNDWEKCELDDLGLDRTPAWIITLIGLNLIWYGVMTVIQFVVIYDFYNEKYELGGIVAAIGGLITTLIPIVGSVVAYWGATELWHWDSLKTFFAFFGYYFPLIGFFIYLAWVIIKTLYADRWYRFRHPEFN